MHFTSIEDYITGKAFSNSLMVKITSTEKSIPFRMETIESIVARKKLIHFGCADHIELIEEKISRNIWLHNRLLSVSNRCVGIDNNPEAIDFLQSKLNINEVYCCNIEKEELPVNVKNEKYDYLLLGEIVEHVDNPVHFLDIIRQKFGSLVNRMIITAPNAFKWNNCKNAFKNAEYVNSDHRYWFTPYTLSKVLSQAGFHDMALIMVESNKLSKYAIIRRFLCRRYPVLRDTILLEASF